MQKHGGGNHNYKSHSKLIEDKPRWYKVNSGSLFTFLISIRSLYEVYVLQAVIYWQELAGFTSKSMEGEIIITKAFLSLQKTNHATVVPKEDSENQVFLRLFANIFLLVYRMVAMFLLTQKARLGGPFRYLEYARKVNSRISRSL